MSTIREGVEALLRSRETCSPYLIPHWSTDLESQFLVHAGSIEAGNNCWTDGEQEWAPHRWPYKAGSDPNYQDKKLKFDPLAHISMVGSTWWNYKTRRSVAVAFDIDVEEGHAETTTTVNESQLADIVEKLKGLDYVTLVRSTGGRGVHVYVFFDEADQPEAQNHNEHTQVALATLEKMKQDSDYDLSQHMDAKGLVFWFWADTSGEDHAGFTLIQEATQRIGASHIGNCIKSGLSNPNNKITVHGWNEDGSSVESTVEGGGYKVYDLETAHKEILTELEDMKYSFIWQADFNMAHTHTCALKQLFEKRKAEGRPLKGIFETVSAGNDPGKPNCYITPRPGGVFMVKRFGNGIGEHASWETKDQNTWCYYNQAVPTSKVLRRFCSKQPSVNRFTFSAAELEAACLALGHSLGESINDIKSAVTVTRREDGTFYASCQDTDHIEGWKRCKDGHRRELPFVEKSEDRVVSVLDDVDEIARFLLTPQHETYGWALKTSIGWIRHRGYDAIAPKIAHIFGKEANFVRSLMLDHPWVITNQPFALEYPEIRKWNIFAPQLAIQPASEPGPHKHWDLVYDHLGSSLDNAAQESEWCQKWGIETGGDYLRFWMASLIQCPFEPLAYLFFYGPQNSGKSIFHESAAILFTEGSVESVTGALTNPSGFNYEIANCVMGHIEEKNLSNVKDGAYARLKEWITGRRLTITKKGETPYSQPNVLKMVHMANRPGAVLMEDGDTRITALSVSIIDKIIPKGLLEKRLTSEAPAFLRTLLTTHIPETPDRLRVPMLASEDKADLESMNQEQWESFAADALFPCEGESVKFTDFYDSYRTHCLLSSREPEKPKALIQLVRNRGDKYKVGYGKNKCLHIANVSLDQKTVSASPKLVLNKKGRLVQCIE